MNYLFIYKPYFRRFPAAAVTMLLWLALGLAGWSNGSLAKEHSQAESAPGSPPTAKPAVGAEAGTAVGSEWVPLPAPRLQGPMSLEETLLRRRSVRDFTTDSLTLAEVSQLLWAAQGVTDARGLRTAPSAGALYPLEVYLVVGRVEGVAPGLYHYTPSGHRWLCLRKGALQAELSQAALGQRSIERAPAVMVIGAVYERTAGKYGRERSARYVPMEAGHAAQNVCLQAVSLGKATVVVGAFTDDKVKRILSLPDPVEVLYLIPIGKAR
jgi:SagB-type dehydrogenase family enzyme